MAQVGNPVTTIIGDVHPGDMDGTFRDFFDVPFYIPDEQIYKYLEKKGHLSKRLKDTYEINL